MSGSNPTPSGSGDTWWFEQRWNDFRRGHARLELIWDEGRAAAQLYDDGAPATVAAVLALVPLRLPFVQVAWSGEMVMGTKAFPVPGGEPENQVRLVRPGDLTWDAKYGELCVVYGDAECRLPSGPNTVTVFGHVDAGADELFAFCRARRFRGAGQLRLVQADGGRGTTPGVAQ